jgi:uncharacterized protein
VQSLFVVLKSYPIFGNSSKEGVFLMQINESLSQANSTNCTFFRSSKIEIAFLGGKGRGVIASSSIEAHEIIEFSPVIVLPVEQIDQMKRTLLYHYFFQWGQHKAALCLGYGSIYNHSKNPNCKYLRDFQNSAMQFVALRNIPKGEEICTNYNGNENCKRSLYFE